MKREKYHKTTSAYRRHNETDLLSQRGFQCNALEKKMSETRESEEPIAQTMHTMCTSFIHVCINLLA